jgi:glycosyltransferase involved in cell wall biosynthesis
VLLSIGHGAAGEKAIEIEARRRGLDCVPLRMRDGPNLAGARQIAEIAAARNIDVIHSHGYKSNILLALLPRRVRRVPVVTTLHGWTAKRALSKLGLYRSIDQLLLPRLDAVVVVNERMKDLPALKRLRRGVHAIPNGVTSASGEAPAANARDAIAEKIAALRTKHATILAVVGRLSPEKNVGGLLEAMHALSSSRPEAALLVLGAGPEFEAIQRRIVQLGLTDRVVLGGYVANARDYLPLIDVIVIPSLTEGLPMILLEAMSARVPVISTRVGDIPAVLADFGVLVEPGDSRALADAIGRTLDRMPEARALAARAAERVETHYSAAAMAGRYADVYRSVVSGPVS